MIQVLPVQCVWPCPLHKTFLTQTMLSHQQLLFFLLSMPASRSPHLLLRRSVDEKSAKSEVLSNPWFLISAHPWTLYSKWCPPVNKAEAIWFLCFRNYFGDTCYRALYRRELYEAGSTHWALGENKTIIMHKFGTCCTINSSSDPTLNPESVSRSHQQSTSLLQPSQPNALPYELAKNSLAILHFNDVYNIEGRETEPVGGAARFKTCLDKFHHLNPLTLFSGDALSPSNSKLIFTCCGHNDEPSLPRNS